MLSEANLSVSVCVSEATEMLTNKDREDLFESICLLIESYIDVNIQQYIQPNFHLSVFNAIVNTITNTLMDLDLDIKELVEKEVERALALFYKHIA